MQSKFIFFLFSIVLLLSACSEDDSTMGFSSDKLSKEIQQDINTRFSKSEIKYCYQTSDGLIQITLVDENSNEAQLYYKDNQFQAEYSKIPRLADLPEAILVKIAEMDTIGMKDLSIYKTKRSYIEKELYSFYFYRVVTQTSNMTYNVFINQDSTLLSTINHTVNDAIALQSNYKTQFDYVKEKYPKADTRCQLNNLGTKQLIVLDEGYIKTISFGSDNPSGSNFWEKTEYEVPSDYEVPAEVLAQLELAAPGFIYTNLFITEVPTSMSYAFYDYKQTAKPGYKISVTQQ